MYISIDDIRRHLNIDYTEDDSYLEELIEAAEASVELYLQRPLSELVGDQKKLHPSAKHAIRVLVGNFYANREATAYATPSEIQFGLGWLLTPLKVFK